MNAHRLERIRESMREELSELLGYEMEDPRIRDVDVKEVILTPDMRKARVRLHLEGDLHQKAQCLAAVQGASVFLRRQLAMRLRLYRIPELQFEVEAQREGSQ